MTPEVSVDRTDDGELTLTITPGRTGTITGWPEAAEDLDLLGPGPKEAHGIEVVSEHGEYHDPDDDYPYGYSLVELSLDDEETLSWARDRLYDKATERFEWGTGDATDVQDFAGALPTSVEAAEE